MSQDLPIDAPTNDGPVRGPALPNPATQQSARDAALAATAAITTAPTSLVDYRSRGAVLIAGPTPAALAAAEKLTPALHAVVVVSPGSGEGLRADSTSKFTPVEGRLHAVTGYLGAFRAHAQGKDEPLELGPLSPNADGLYDLVLDLCEEPVLRTELPPPGYYAPGADQERLAAALEELRGLRGEFEKPKYFNYDPSICAHSRRGLTACTRCIDACPAEAIRSIGEQVEVDPHLCQGGGSCTSVCPSGAMTYAYPSPEDSLTRLKTLLQTFLSQGGKGAVLLLHDQDRGNELWTQAQGVAGAHVLPFPLEELAATGMELWLAAIAYGADELVLLLSPEVPPRSRRTLQEQVAVAGAVLAAMGHGADRIRLWEPPSELMSAPISGHLPSSLTTAGTWSPISPASFAPIGEKRTLAFMAIDHLYAQAPKPRPFIDLPSGAPFGTVQLDDARCTLCMGCVAVCPGRALQDGVDQPQLKFIEGNCLQCGMCTRACPEDAIAISPRLLFLAERRREARLLKEEVPFPCIRCGKPFSTQSMVERITSRLKDHPMFQGSALNRLRMCEDCRVRDMLTSEQGEEWFDLGRGA